MKDSCENSGFEGSMSICIGTPAVNVRMQVEPDAFIGGGVFPIVMRISFSMGHTHIQINQAFNPTTPLKHEGRV